MNEKDSIKRAVPPQLPEEGGIVWVAGGVPISALPLPCSKCIEFLAQMNDEELAHLLVRIRTQTNQQPGT